MATPTGVPPKGRLLKGAIAQLGERFNGIEEVVGSIPSGSTIPSLNFQKLIILRSHKCKQTRLETVRSSQDQALKNLESIFFRDLFFEGRELLPQPSNRRTIRSYLKKCH